MNWIWALVAMELSVDPQLHPLPTVHLKSNTSLQYFQKAIYPQWHFYPNEIVNSYVVHRREIFLNDDPASYPKEGERCLNDGLAHELVHFIQDVYHHYDLNDESLEWQAVEVQTKLRPMLCPKVPYK